MQVIGITDLSNSVLGASKFKTANCCSSPHASCQAVLAVPRSPAGDLPVQETRSAIQRRLRLFGIESLTRLQTRCRQNSKERPIQTSTVTTFGAAGSKHPACSPPRPPQCTHCTQEAQHQLQAGDHLRSEVPHHPSELLEAQVGYKWTKSMQ